MAGIDNLIPNEQRTPEERRRNARKAGIASRESSKGKSRPKKESKRDIGDGRLQSATQRNARRKGLERDEPDGNRDGSFAKSLKG